MFERLLEIQKGEVVGFLCDIGIAAIVVGDSPTTTFGKYGGNPIRDSAAIPFGIQMSDLIH